MILITITIATIVAVGAILAIPFVDPNPNPTILTIAVSCYLAQRIMVNRLKKLWISILSFLCTYTVDMCRNENDDNEKVSESSSSSSSGSITPTSNLDLMCFGDESYSTHSCYHRAEYNMAKDVYMVNYNIDGDCYTMILPARMVRHRRRYKYTDEHGRHVESIDRFTGPLENFHGVPLNLEDIPNTSYTQLHRLDTHSPTRMPIVIDHTRDLLYNLNDCNYTENAGGVYGVNDDFDYEYHYDEGEYYRY